MTLISFAKASYLGGHPSLPVSQPLTCQLTINDETVSLVDPVSLSSVEIRWSDVRTLEVMGANDGELRTSPTGAFFLGIVGLAMQQRRWTACMALTLNSGSAVAILVADYTSQSLRAQLYRVEAAVALLDQAGRSPKVAWEYRTSDIEGLNDLGADGWEAVGVFADAGSPQVLLKRQTT